MLWKRGFFPEKRQPGHTLFGIRRNPIPYYGDHLSTLDVVFQCKNRLHVARREFNDSEIGIRVQSIDHGVDFLSMAAMHDDVDLETFCQGKGPQGIKAS